MGINPSRQPSWDIQRGGTPMTNIQIAASWPQSETQERLDRLLTDIQSASSQQIGYPANQNFDYSALLPFLQYSLNNVGDPFHSSNYWSNTHGIEREVITRFAGLMQLDPEEAWGYVTSGGTESNLYGLYLAREMFPNGIFYFSEETHYSISQEPASAERPLRHDQTPGRWRD